MLPRIGKFFLAAAFMTLASSSVFAQKLKPCIGQDTEDMGYCDEKTGKIVIPPAYMDAQPFRGDHAVVLLRDESYKVIDKTGKIVINEKYFEIATTDIPGLFLVNNDKGYGLVRSGDQVVIPVKYSFIDFWEVGTGGNHEKIGPATLLTLYVAIDSVNFDFGLATPEGKILIQPTQDLFWVANDTRSTRPPRTLAETRYVAKKGGKFLVHDGNGKQIGEAPGFFGFWGMNLLCQEGEKIIFRKAENLEVISAPQNLKEDYTTVSISEKWGVISRKGKLTVPAIYSKVTEVSLEEGKSLFVAVKDGKAGVVDPDNKQVIPFLYESIDKLYSGSAEGGPYFTVRKDGKYGVINGKGSIIGSIKYDKIGMFMTDKKADIELNGKKGHLTLSGEEVWEK